MVSVYMNGKDKTPQITHWKIWYNDQDSELMLTCYFPSGKNYTQPMKRCEIVPTESLSDNVLICNKQSIVTEIARADIYGKKFAAVYYLGNDKPYVYECNNIEITRATNLKNEAVFNYFINVAKERIEQADDKAIDENVLRQLEKVSPHPDTVLNAYCFIKNQKREAPKYFIYPFGINDSQLKAVENAFLSQISIIEGPPGTGKTQTILNIVANILVNNKTVAVLSNNNAAVENVYEKLASYELDYLVAKLGSSDNRTAFFNSDLTISVEKENHAIDLSDIDSMVNKLKSHLHAQNQVALLQAQIDELNIEKAYLQQWQSGNVTVSIESLDKYRFSSKKIVELLAYLHYLAERKISFKDRLRLLFNFKILRTQFINNWQKRKALFYTLQLAYYEWQLREKMALLTKYQQILKANQFQALLDCLTESSIHYLKSHLSQTIDRDAEFTARNYQQKFADFTKRFPIIGSSSHSIINSIGTGALLDYLIIDEASQQDIIPGILGLGCARNVIIVGDRKQLPHVPIKLSIAPPHEYYDCDRYSLLDSFVQLFQDKIPVTLLKEHYRCHPKIIQFCNKQFYDNQLIPMTIDKGEEALRLITTAAGNHTRNFTNLRELDSIIEIGLQDFDENNTGFIAPYNKQVNLSKTHLPKGIIKATTHKFQGRECDNIIFSTVLDKKLASQKQLAFVDDPNLVNVAVSRAKNKFVLVTGNDVFTKSNQSIAALIRYIKYYANSSHVHDSPVISAFDLLYQEYDESLVALNERLRSNDSKFKSEQIVAQLLRQMLRQQLYQTMMFHQQVRLIQLISILNNTFTQREQDYMQNRASCDFVVYFKTGKNPIGVIEVDGHYHNEPKQIERDEVKNAILAKVGIPLLRLKTVESHIEEKIEAFLTGITYESR